jgi:hypothetical protein
MVIGKIPLEETGQNREHWLLCKHLPQANASSNPKVIPTFVEEDYTGCFHRGGAEKERFLFEMSNKGGSCDTSSEIPVARGQSTPEAPLLERRLALLIQL